MRTNPEEPLRRIPSDDHQATAPDARPKPSPPSASQPPRPQRRRHRSFLFVAVLLAVLLGVWIVYRIRSSRASSAAAGGRAAGAGPVPVVETVVATKNVPIYLDGLGTVQAFNSVTVHSRVDGQLMKVAFNEGQDVTAGSLLAQIDPAPYQAALDQALAKKAQDDAQLANARVDLKRYRDLLATESVTQQAYDTQKALIAQLDATVKADQAAIDSARINLEYTAIRSPIDGRTGLRQIDQGNIVHASDAGGLVVLTQLRPISVVFTLPEQALSKLEQRTGFQVLAVSRDTTTVLAEGTLTVIDNQIDWTTGTVKLKAQFANENLRLWPGQFVNTRLLLTVRTNGVVVPASVVQRGPEGAFAFVIQDDQTASVRPIRVVQIERGEALIDEGLQPGEHVVVDGQYKLQAGAHVKRVEPGSGSGGQGPSGEQSTPAPAAPHNGQPGPRPKAAAAQPRAQAVSTRAPAAL